MCDEKVKSALVVEGGAMRGIFSTGILDAFLIERFNPFDMHIGVSAGATNLASYLANMYQRNYKVYTDYSLRRDFISWKKFLLGGHLIDLDWLWDITIKEVRLDIEAILEKKEYYVGITEVDTGKIKFVKPVKDSLEGLLKASSAIPMFYRNFVKVEDREYVDGGLADPIPVIEAYKRGARKIMVLRSRPHSFVMEAPSKPWVLKVFFRKYPNLKKAMLNRDKVYQEAIDFMRKPPSGVEIIEVNPPSTFQTKRLTKDLEILNKDYQIGREIGLDLISKWR